MLEQMGVIGQIEEDLAKSDLDGDEDGELSPAARRAFNTTRLPEAKQNTGCHGKVTVQSGWVMEDCWHHMETFYLLTAGPLFEEARVKAIMTEKELASPAVMRSVSKMAVLGHMYKRMQGAVWFVTRWGLQNVVTEEDGPERKAQVDALIREGRTRYLADITAYARLAERNGFVSLLVSNLHSAVCRMICQMLAYGHPLAELWMENLMGFLKAGAKRLLPKNGYMAPDDAGPGAVETPIRLVGSASAAWDDAVDFKNHLEKLPDDVRRTVHGSHSYAPILVGWGAVLPGWTPSGGVGGLLAYKAASLRNGDKPRLHWEGGGGDGETSRDNSFFVYKMLKQVPDADPPPYTTEELEIEEELPSNLLAERDDAKYSTMVARAQHFYLATPPPPPGTDLDDSRASARPIPVALCTVWTPERAHTAVGLDLWRVRGGGGGSGGEEALVLLDGPGIRKVAVLMAPAHMSSA
eukprot:jgi/Tetstr1/445589/TSEL_033361.t1